MTRLFEQHRVRHCISLNGEWEYAFPASGTHIAADQWGAGDIERVPVPGVWEMLPSRVNYRGQALARTTFVASQSGPARLVFKGVSHTVTVCLDGVEVGHHHNAFTPFAIEIPELSEGTHELLLCISNEHGDVSALHVPNDYYNYGGVSRPVEIQFLKRPLFIRHVHVTTTETEGQWQAELVAVVRNLADAATVDLTIQLAGATVESKQVACSQGDTVIPLQVMPPSVTPWSPETPQLYPLMASLADDDAVVDDWNDRIGFRTVTTDGETVLLNGKPLFMVGFNRHEDHPDFGCAIPVEVMRQDLRLFREMNCNAVRTCHYPNDERFLDLCDEMGFVVWEENHARGFDIEKMLHPRFHDQCESCNEEMVREHFNHPSIVMWGLLNECESGTEEGAAMYQEQIDQLRALDSSRPITFASCRHAKDLCQGMVDICGWNVYSRWYTDKHPKEDLDALIGRMDPDGMAGKPLIISEFGAGAIPGFHDPIRRGKWSEERQADIMEELLETYQAHPRVGGLFIWQFCDVRVDDAWSNARPRTMNNKGIVDEHRRPKLAYEVVKEWFGKLGRQGYVAQLHGN
ncbi:MAG: glycoside hydrolase family 2 TIM barrel-domain containing protein [Kiritimatiellia bacterium]|jgi:beta-glucuronidase|nr:glycoside hydrolase family 2 TIM barrel-domain containing protein [Kiritimatiellia bacterium]